MGFCLFRCSYKIIQVLLNTSLAVSSEWVFDSKCRLSSSGKFFPQGYNSLELVVDDEDSSVY